MKCLTKMTALFLLLCANCFAQVICVAEKEFRVSAIAKRSGLEASVTATFDVINFQPENIRFNTAKTDTLPLADAFIEDTKYNIKQVTYLNDTTNFRLKFNYRIESSRKLSAPFARIIS